MQRAVAAVEKQGESLRHASEKYGVPRSSKHITPPNGPEVSSWLGHGSAILTVIAG